MRQRTEAAAARPAAADQRAREEGDNTKLVRTERHALDKAAFAFEQSARQYVDTSGRQQADLTPQLTLLTDQIACAEKLGFKLQSVLNIKDTNAAALEAAARLAAAREQAMFTQLLEVGQRARVALRTLLLLLFTELVRAWQDDGEGGAWVDAWVDACSMLLRLLFLLLLLLLLLLLWLRRLAHGLWRLLWIVGIGHLVLERHLLHVLLHAHRVHAHLARMTTVASV